jgi:hypothetical protein
MKPFTSKHMFGAHCKTESPLKQMKDPKAGTELSSKEKRATKYAKKIEEKGPTKKAYDLGKKTVAGQGFKKNTGLETDPKSGYLKSKGYEKKFVEPSKETGYKAMILSGDGKMVASAKSERVGGKYNPKGGKEVENLRKRFQKDSTETMNARKANAIQANALIKTAGGPKR